MVVEGKNSAPSEIPNVERYKLVLQASEVKFGYRAITAPENVYVIRGL